jgi:class 3 adenylate cyclase
MANQQVTRNLGAIVAIDAVGYSRQMGRDEEATRRTLQTYREMIAERVVRAGGRVFGVAGDSAMAVLPDTLAALTCALEIERAVEALGANLPEARRMPLRIGIHFGRVRVEGEDVYGDDVNIAARIEALAGAGGICLSGTAFERVEGVLPLGYEAYGPQRLKNIARPVAVYRVRREAEMVGRVVPGKAPRPRSRWRLVAAVAALVAAGAGVWSLYLQDQAAERNAGLRAALHDAESRVADERSLTAELQSALQAAAREAARRSAEAAQTETLLRELRESESRAATERKRSEELQPELQSTIPAPGTAEERRAERQRAETLIGSWQIAERHAGVERVLAEGLLADLDAAASRAADRADAAGARVSDRNRIADLLTALSMNERKRAQDIESAEALLAVLQEGDDSAERAQAEALLATLQEAGQSTAIERKRAELVLNSRDAPKDVAADAVVHAKARDRAEALLARWREAEDTAVTERLRAEALLAKQDLAEAPPPPRRRPAELERVKEQLAIIKGGAEPEPEQRAEDEVPAVPAREAVTPTSSQPENGPAAPQATAQLAALPSQPEATDAAADKAGEEASDAASLEAVEWLLQERQPELLDALNAYLPSALTEFAGGLKRVKQIWGIKVLGRKGDSYRVRMDFEPTHLSFDSNQIMNPNDQPYHYSRDAVVLVKTTGAELKIAGHEYVSK